MNPAAPHGRAGRPDRRPGLALLVACVGGALLGAGCPPPYPQCENDGHCEEQGEVCVQGQCRECALDEHCKDGFECVENLCQPEAECSPSRPCPGGSACEGGRCVEAAEGCQTDDQCEGSQRCEQGMCVEGPATCRADAACDPDERCVEGTCQPASALRCDPPTVHFEFNDFTVDANARDELAELAGCMERAVTRWTLAGHADERGTEEYNLQLSNRRAEAVRSFLTDLGVPRQKLEAFGYGENRPAVEGSGEEVWRRNRRVEIRPR